MKPELKGEKMQKWRARSFSTFGCQDRKGGIEADKGKGIWDLENMEPIKITLASGNPSSESSFVSRINRPRQLRSHPNLDVRGN